MIRSDARDQEANTSTVKLLWVKVLLGEIRAYTVSMRLGDLGWMPKISRFLFIHPGTIGMMDVIYLHFGRNVNKLNMFLLRHSHKVIGLGGLGMISALISSQQCFLIIAITGCCVFCFHVPFVDAFILINYLMLP